MDSIPYEIIEIIISCLKLDELENFIEYIQSFINLTFLNWKVIFEYNWRSSIYYEKWDNKIDNYSDYYNYIVSYNLFETDLMDDITIGDISLMERLTIVMYKNEIISKNIGKLRSLEELSLIARSERISEEIYEENLVTISKFTNINCLNISFSNLDIHLCIFYKFTNITKLNISNSCMYSFPKSICKLNNLTSLTLDECSIKELPDKVSKLINLTELNMNNNYLHNFDLICKLTQLRYLTLSLNNINIIPLELFKLNKLELLDLFGNKIKVIPLDIIKLSNLMYLRLNYNEIEVLDINLTPFLENLTQYELDHNKIARLPNNFNLSKF